MRAAVISFWSRAAILVATTAVLFPDSAVCGEPAARLSQNSEDSTQTDCSCFRGRPSPECCDFWVVETSLCARLNSSPVRENTGNVVVTIDAGPMVNIGRNWALGATVYGSVDFDVEEFRIGLRPRLRRWLKQGLSLDISPGLILGGSYDGHDVVEMHHPGFVGLVSLSLYDLIALRFQVESFKVVTELYDWEGGSGYMGRRDETVTEYYAGASLCSYAGVGGAVIVGIVLIVLLMELQAMSDWGWN